MINEGTGHVEDADFTDGVTEIQEAAVALLKRYEHLDGKDFRYLGYVLTDAVNLSVTIHTMATSLRKGLKIENSTE
jgi:hypothetical protein